jgi:ABC-2 type transport system ATP-binding protein
MHEPELLFLDEPSTGLDPQSRLFVHERVQALNERGVTVLVTTHDMHEAEKLSERIAIVDHGKVLALDTPDALRRLVPSASAVELVVAPRNGGAPDQQSLIAALGGVRDVERVETVAAAEPAFGPAPPKLRVYSTRAPELVPAVLETVAAHGAEAADLRITRPTLEDVFIHLTGRALR